MNHDEVALIRSENMNNNLSYMKNYIILYSPSMDQIRLYIPTIRNIEFCDIISASGRVPRRDIIQSRKFITFYSYLYCSYFCAVTELK